MKSLVGVCRTGWVVRTQRRLCVTAVNPTVPGVGLGGMLQDTVVEVKTEPGQQSPDNGQ